MRKAHRYALNMQLLRRNQQSPMLLFLHVQKCGGTTLRTLIDRNYERTVNLNEWKYRAGWDVMKNFHAMSPEQQKKRRKLLQSYQALYGHFPFGIHTLLQCPYTYITVLREPVDRFISLYEYWRGSSYDERMGDTLAEFSSTNVFGWLLKDNHMVRVFCDGLTIPYGGVTEAHLDSAMENLTQCDFVGIMEEFDTTVACLRQFLGWEHSTYTQENVNRKRKNRNASASIDPATLAKIEDRVWLDRKLYAYACELFAKQKLLYSGTPV